LIVEPDLEHDLGNFKLKPRFKWTPRLAVRWRDQEVCGTTLKVIKAVYLGLDAATRMILNLDVILTEGGDCGLNFWFIECRRACIE
jgi:hypothetical protein